MLMPRNQDYHPSPLSRILTLIDLGSLVLIFVLAPIVRPTLLDWKPTNIEYSKESSRFAQEFSLASNILGWSYRSKKATRPHSNSLFLNQ